MTLQEFFTALMSANAVNDVASALHSFEEDYANRIRWAPFGRENNRGAVEASTDPGRSLVERITNGIDAVLEAEHNRRNGHPDCQSPKEAATAWLSVPDGGLGEMTPQLRYQLA